MGIENAVTLPLDVDRPCLKLDQALGHCDWFSSLHYSTFPKQGSVVHFPAVFLLPSPFQRLHSSLFILYLIVDGFQDSRRELSTNGHTLNTADYQLSIDLLDHYPGMYKPPNFPPPG